MGDSLSASLEIKDQILELYTSKMKLKLAAVAALGAVAAQPNPIDAAGVMEVRSIGALIDVLPRSMLFGWYVTMITRNEDLDRKTLLYLEALQQKAQFVELPDHIFYPAMDYLSGAQDRALDCTGGSPCNVPISLRILHAYGCWCNLGEDLTKGHGDPMDGYDDACKYLQLCLRCVLRDTKD